MKKKKKRRKKLATTLGEKNDRVDTPADLVMTDDLPAEGPAGLAMMDNCDTGQQRQGWQ